MAAKAPGKHAYGRVIEIDRLLRQDRFPTVGELADRFKVSQRTIERDIESLRDYFDAPIVYNRSKKTYSYSDKSYRLSAIMLSQEELVSILVSERLLRHYAGTPFEPVIQQAFSKLVDMLPATASLSVDVANLCKAVVFEQGIPIREYSLEVFVTLLEAIAKKQRCEIAHYTVSGNREEGTRFVDPYHIANWGGDWYLVARCLKRKETSNFHLGRIREAYPLDLFFDPPKDFDAKKHIASGFGKIAGDNREKVRLQVVPSASRWVREKVWHFTQKFEKMNDDGSVVLSMDVPNDAPGKETLRRWILQFGNEAQVLEPSWLRSEIREHLQSGARQYD